MSPRAWGTPAFRPPGMPASSGSPTACTPAGRPLRSIEIPQTPANLAFGDSDLATLYVTALSALYRVHVDRMEALNGTPILDIKPVLPRIDAR